MAGDRRWRWSPSGTFREEAASEVRGQGAPTSRRGSPRRRTMRGLRLCWRCTPIANCDGCGSLERLDRHASGRRPSEGRALERLLEVRPGFEVPGCALGRPTGDEPAAARLRTRTGLRHRDRKVHGRARRDGPRQCIARDLWRSPPVHGNPRSLRAHGDREVTVFAGAFRRSAWAQMQTSVTSCRPPFRTVTRSSRHRTPDEVVALRTYVPGRRSSENEPSLLAEAIEGRHTCRSAFDLSCRIGTLGHVEESHAELNRIPSFANSRDFSAELVGAHRTAAYELGFVLPHMTSVARRATRS